MADPRARIPKAPPRAVSPPRTTEPPPELGGAVVTVGGRPPPPRPPQATAPRPASAPATGRAKPGADEEHAVALEELEAVNRPAPPANAAEITGYGPTKATYTHKDPAAPILLVVEDDGAIRAMIVRALAVTYTVFEAEDGQAALDLLGRMPSPACIVSDWMMPRLDGLGLAKRIRADTTLLRWTPFIFLTAKNAPSDVIEGVNAGARHYLAKPFKMKELLDKVGEILGPRK